MPSPHDNTPQRVGWYVAPSTRMMLVEVMKLINVLDNKRATVDPALRAILPDALAKLRRRCRSAGIDPDYVCKLTSCRIESSYEQWRYVDEPDDTGPDTTTKPSGKHVKSTPQAPEFYSSAPMNDIPNE